MEKRGFGIAGFIISLGSIIFMFLFPILGILLGIVGLILCIIQFKKGKTGLAICWISYKHNRKLLEVYLFSSQL